MENTNHGNTGSNNSGNQEHFREKKDYEKFYAAEAGMKLVNGEGYNVSITDKDDTETGVALVYSMYHGDTHAEFLQNPEVQKRMPQALALSLKIHADQSRESRLNEKFGEVYKALYAWGMEKYGKKEEVEKFINKFKEKSYNQVQEDYKKVIVEYQELAKKRDEGEGIAKEVFEKFEKKVGIYEKFNNLVEAMNKSALEGKRASAVRKASYRTIDNLFNK